MTDETKNDLLERLWASDAASALTNEAARYIEAQEALIEEMREALEMTRATVGDLRRGFASYVTPSAWVEQLQSYIDSILSKAKSQQEGETE